MQVNVDATAMPTRGQGRAISEQVLAEEPLAFYLQG